MRVIVPVVTLHPLTEASLRLYAPTAERIDVSQSDRAYCDLLARLWAEGESVLLVEHDIEIHAGVVEAARRCRHLWCAWPYEGGAWANPGDSLLYESLGCTKFSAKMMSDEPDLLAVAAALTQGLPAGDWRRMDVSVAPTLKQRGYTVHSHGPVIHHHDYPGVGCSCGQAHR